MFSYPLPIPRDTCYQQLGLEPDATPQEINEALIEQKSKLYNEKLSLERALEEIYKEFPGLKETYNEMRTLQSKKEPANPEPLRHAQRRLVELELKALAKHPNLKPSRKRVEEIEAETVELNRLPIAKADSRKEYDRAHPPLELLQLADCTRSSFTENKTALLLLRRELSRFLAAQGETVFHPSDLTREDFTADFSPNPLLDGEER
jgi:hypothetical protein